MMRKMTGFGLALVAAALTGAATADEIAVTGSTIRGIDRPDGSHLYFAIPYAAPPVGALRKWRAAQCRPVLTGEETK